MMVDGTASGVLARKGAVWLANIPNLWLLRDADGGVPEVALARLRAHPGARWEALLQLGDRGLHVVQKDRAISNPDSGAVLRCNPGKAPGASWAT